MKKYLIVVLSLIAGSLYGLETNPVTGSTWDGGSVTSAITAPNVTATYGGVFSTVTATSKLNVGVAGGTPHSSSLLNIFNTTAASSLSLQLMGAADSTEYIFFGDVGSATQSYIQYTHGADLFKFVNNGNENIVMNASGDVTISTKLVTPKVELNTAFEVGIATPTVVGQIIRNSAFVLYIGTGTSNAWQWTKVGAQ